MSGSVTQLMAGVNIGFQDTILGISFNFVSRLMTEKIIGKLEESIVEIVAVCERD